MDRGLGNFPPYVAPRADGPMDEQAVEGVVQMAIQDAISYVDEELGNDRATATDYYHGKPYGNEVNGRSQVVTTEVRDGIIAIEPSILRVIHGPEHAVEFVPSIGADVPMAEQATDYVRWVYENDNHGFLVSRSVLRDGLLKKIGVAKWGMTEEPCVKTTKYSGLTREMLAEVLMQHPDATVGNAVIREGGLVDVEVTTTEPVGRIWVEPIPPDDFFWNREARSLDDAIIVGYRARLTRGTLLKMGISEEDIDNYGGSIGVGEETPEEQARRMSAVSGLSTDPEMGAENRRHLFCEVYMTLAMKDGKVPELRKLWTLGPAFNVVKNDPADGKPFAIFSPDPEPHAMLGGSWFDRLKDIQKIDSQLLRAVLDSAAIAAFPRVAYVDGQVAVGDILNTAIGAPIRMRQPGMVQSFDQPFTGDKLMPVIGFMQDIIERRTGQKDGAGSLDLDALQSTGKEAVNAAILAAQSQPELVARLFCEQFLKPMFRGILKLAVNPKSKERIIRLRGTYVPVNPQSFDPDMDVSVNVALGSMDTAKKIAVLRDVVADQSAILQQYGPENPVVDIAMLRNAKADILRLEGVKNVESYYKPVDPNWQPPPPPPAQPSPDELWIQAEKEMAFQKQMKELAIKQDELALKERQLNADIAFRDRELAIKEAETFRGPDRSMDQYKVDTDLAMRERELASAESLELRKLELDERKMELDAEMRRYEADLQALTASQANQNAIELANIDAQKPLPDAPEKSEPSEPKEKPEPVVVHVHNAMPEVKVSPVIHNHPPKGKKKGKMTAPDGSEYTMESEDDD